MYLFLKKLFNQPVYICIQTNVIIMHPFNPQPFTLTYSHKCLFRTSNYTEQHRFRVIIKFFSALLGLETS